MILDTLADAQMPRPSFLQNSQRPSFLQNWQRPSFLQPQQQPDLSQLWNTYAGSMFGGIGVPNQQDFQQRFMPMAEISPILAAHRMKMMNSG